MGDVLNTTKKTWLRRLAGAVLFCVAGIAISPVGGAAAHWQRENQPALHSAELDGVMGQGVLLGVFGGLRSVFADFAWVRGYVHSERDNRLECEAMMRLAIALDPGNKYFWLQAGDVIGRDFPYMIFKERGGERRLDPGVKKFIRREQAERAVELLKKGVMREPENSEFYIRLAQISENGIQDIPVAAEYYRQAAECPKPVWFASRVYVNFLFEKLEKKQEALAWYRDYIARLKAGRFGKGAFIDTWITDAEEHLAELEKR